MSDNKNSAAPPAGRGEGEPDMYYTDNGEGIELITDATQSLGRVYVTKDDYDTLAQRLAECERERESLAHQARLSIKTACDRAAQAEALLAEMTTERDVARTKNQWNLERADALAAELANLHARPFYGRVTVESH